MRATALRTAQRGAAVLMLVAGGGSGARAQPDSLAAAAESAFEEGMQAMKQGNYARACPLLEESLKWDPGMAAEFRLAECYERAGRLATAWATYLQVSEEARAASMTERADFARARADALAPRLPSLVIQIPAALAADPELEVRCDGELVSRPFWGAPMPVDPGSHRVLISSPGKGRWIRSGRVDQPGATRTVTFTGFAVPTAAPAQAPTSSGPGPLEVVGIVTAVAGAAVLGAGIGVGLAARSRYDDAASHCVASRCDDEGTAVRQAALDQAALATGLSVAGALGLAGGGALWLGGALGAPADTEASTGAPAAGGSGRTHAWLGESVGVGRIVLAGAW